MESVSVQIFSQNFSTILHLPVDPVTACEWKSHQNNWQRICKAVLYMVYGISIQTFSHCVWWCSLMCCHGVLFLLHISSSYYKQLITICTLVELQSSPSFPLFLYPQKQAQICLFSEFWSLASNSCLFFCLLDATSYGSGELKMKKKKTNALPPFHPLLQIVSLHIGAVSHSLQHWHVIESVLWRYGSQTKLNWKALSFNQIRILVCYLESWSHLEEQNPLYDRITHMLLTLL